MPEFLVDYADMRADNSIWIHDQRDGKHKALKIGDFIQTHDATGNSCHGIIEKLDADTSLILLALDRSTWKDAVR